jgi:hypothetical protein
LRIAIEETREPVRGKQVIFTALVDDTPIAIAFCISIGHNFVNLVAFQRRLVARSTHSLGICELQTALPRN